MSRFYARLLSDWVVSHGSTAWNITHSPAHYFTTSRQVSALTELLDFRVSHGSFRWFIVIEWDTCAVWPLVATLGSIGSWYCLTESNFCFAQIKRRQASTLDLGSFVNWFLDFSQNSTTCLFKEGWRFDKAEVLYFDPLQRRHTSPGRLWVQITVNYSLPSLLVLSKLNRFHACFRQILIILVLMDFVLRRISESN